MQKLIIYINKLIKKAFTSILKPIDRICINYIFYSNGISLSTFRSHGIPKVNVGIGGEFTLGKNFRMNNREMSNPIGRFKKCSIIVGKKGKLIIGNNVGMSSTAIVCHNRIEIGNNVNIGGNVVIYDTDFHSLNPTDRLDRVKDINNTKTKPVKIGNNAFIGAHSTILKGVSIGENSIVGACSVVTKNVPPNEIWAGNPAKFLKSLEIE